MRPHPLQCHAPKLSYHHRGSVFNAFGDETPGPRNFDGFHTCGFPWGELMDTSVDVASVDSYRMSMLLSREGLICGPSSGQALQGILDYIGKLKEAGALAQLADPTTDDVSCVFTMSDLPYQYLPQYFKKLGEAEFPEIQNKVRTQISTRVNIPTMGYSRFYWGATSPSTTAAGSSTRTKQPRCWHSRHPKQQQE